MDSSDTPERIEPRVPSIHISTSGANLQDLERIPTPGTPGLLAPVHNASDDDTEAGPDVNGQATQADGYGRTPFNDAEGLPVSEDSQEVAAPDAAELSEDPGQTPEALAMPAEESIPASEPGTAEVPAVGGTQESNTETPVESNEPSSAIAEDDGESQPQVQDSNAEPPVDSNEPHSAIAEQGESQPQAQEANELEPVHESASPPLQGQETNTEPSGSPEESSEEPLDSRPVRPASGGPPLSGPTLFPGPLPTIEASEAVVVDEVWPGQLQLPRCRTCLQHRTSLSIDALFCWCADHLWELWDDP